ncbi:hypothetical protein SRB5_65230 [Streptomyces sp. RB5]|uniref:DUF4034 domain-containing protein n=1 Tax=Streptomyces smaragdinus TaxID=2585196 RepID=A0A7K0CS49_9ACTN|nr:hypothetical protein [Streptomyces smaragdinus]MQY16325.1 hypothetical protein [Streptomyces smaragdinus]
MFDSPPLAGPEFSPLVNFPELGRLRGAATGRDWPTVRAYVSELDDPDMRATAGRIVSETPGAEEFLTGVTRRDKGDVMARVLLAGTLIHVGWSIRTGATANQVSADQFTRFFGYLRRAEKLLIDVCAEDPRNALAWLHRLTTARGLQLGASETRRRYERVAEHHPHFYSAQAQLLQKLCPKWGGTWQEAHGFANECAAAAPPGSLSPLLVAEAHLEHWADRDGPSYDLNSPAAQRELTAAVHQTVMADGFAGDFHWIYAHGLFALVFSLGEHREKAAWHFQVLGNRGSEMPWNRIDGDPVAAYKRHRRAALGRG